MYRCNFQESDLQFTKIHQTFLVTLSEGNCKFQKPDLSDVLRKSVFLETASISAKKGFLRQ